MWELVGKSGTAPTRGGGRDHGKGKGSDQTPIAAAARGMGRGAIFTLPKSVIGVSSVLQPTHRKVSGVVVAGDSSTLRLYASKKMLAKVYFVVTFSSPPAHCRSATVLYSRLSHCVCTVCVPCWQTSGALINMYGIIRFTINICEILAQAVISATHPQVSRPGQPPVLLLLASSLSKMFTLE